MATHSSILAGKSHGQRSLAGYSPQGLKRVRHDYSLATKNKHCLSQEPVFYFSANLLLRQYGSQIRVMIFYKSISVSLPTQPCRNGVVISAFVYNETEMEN